MSTYTKEKNVIVITLDNSNGSYRLDINTGIFYGIKGSPVKTCPRRNEIRSLFPFYRSDNGNNLGYVINKMIRDYTNTSAYPRFVEAMQSADKVDAIGMPLLCLSYEQYEYLGKNMKSLSAWLKENDMEEFSYRSFLRWCEYNKARKSLGAVAYLLTPDMYYALTNHLPNITSEEIGVCAYYLGRGKYWEYHSGSVNTLIHYIEYCRLLDKAPQKVNNFMREYCETKQEYELHKTEFDNKKMALNYAKYAKAWEFEYGNYKIVLPTCGQDIITEGSRMHHCVGSYVDRVIRGETYICFVRHKNTPDECYITCQVYTDGTIGQYFLAYDRYISSAEDKAFYNAFQAHLKSVWGIR
jgi:hypothetical protein